MLVREMNEGLVCLSRVLSDAMRISFKPCQHVVSWECMSDALMADLEKELRSKRTLAHEEKKTDLSPYTTSRYEVVNRLLKRRSGGLNRARIWCNPGPGRKSRLGTLTT